VSEGTRAEGLQGGRSGERGIEEHSSNERDTTTVENFKGPKGLLAPLLNLDILLRPTAIRPPLSPEIPATTKARWEGGQGDGQG
jgi:hypothetical protein